MWLMYPPRYQAIKNARVFPNGVLCNSCKGIFETKNIRVDHLRPITWDNKKTLLETLFVGVEGYQALCKVCHAEKTRLDRQFGPLRAE